MITIPKPCHENWNEMSPKEKGRLCDKCCKVVIDFTKKTASQIVEILQAKPEQKVCGRFRSDQIAVAVPVATSRIPRTRLFLAAVYFVFGGLLFSSCHTTKQPEVMGKIQAPHSFTNGFTNPDTAVKDSLVKKGKKGNCTTEIMEEPNYHIMGDIAFDPADTIPK